MAVLYTSPGDEKTIDTFLRVVLPNQVPGEGDLHKWYALRVALALSIGETNPPGEEWDRSDPKPEPDYNRGEYRLKQVTGENKVGEQAGERDYTKLFKALIGVYHRVDTFADEDRFVVLLRRNIRRGLKIIQNQLGSGCDIYHSLSQSLFKDVHPRVTRVGSEHDELARALKELDIRFESMSVFSGPRIDRYLLQIDRSADYEKLRKRLNGLSHLLGLGEARVPVLQQTRTPKVVALDLPREEETWQTARIAQLCYWFDSDAAKGPVPILLGVDVTGTPYGFDLSDAPHLLVGGTTGSGKSICLRAILYSLLTKYNTSNVKICLIDPKRVEFENYKGLPHLYGGSIYTEVEDCLAVLAGLVAEMERRTAILAERGLVDLQQALRSGFHEIPRLVIFIDELADLIMQSQHLEQHLVRIAQKGRAMGMHLILATQRPDAETFSGLLRSNVPSKIALAVRKAEESRIILGEVGAEKLTGKGDMMVAIIGRKPVRVHGMMVEVEDVLNAGRV